MKKFLLFDYPIRENSQSLILLFLRLFISILMLTHGLGKLFAFNDLATVFPDPIGFGSTPALIMAILAEAGCSLLLIIGAFTRLALLPLMFTMLMAILVIHGNDPFAAKELAVIYLGVYFSLFFLGAGKYSVDYWMFQRNK